MKDLIKSKKFKIAAIAVGAIIVLLFTFSAGILVGFRKAHFSYKFGENYERNFIGQKSMNGPRGMIRDLQGRDFRNGHGITGDVISITDNSIAIKDQNGNENTVTTTDKTVIKSRGNDLKISDLKTGDKIVVLGKPGDNGTVQADLIRVFNNTDNSNSGN
ncbi:MAG: DUF5666 domain-containing protein [Candidatus Moranbacteria bacterium]|nr:DUF5666 domain-containing protein [Candidatus Moranbacteria bacterium]